MDAGKFGLRNWLTLWLSCLLAAPVAGQPTSDRPHVTPAQDDANLHTVQMIGSRVGYAVGDQGAVWKTEDGGQSWQPRPVSEGISLRSASFLSDRLGWVAGVRWQTFTGLSEGVIFVTQDGGEHWAPVSEGQFPAIVAMKWFSPEEALVVCRPETPGSTGIYRTEDGGKNWQPLTGTGGANWLTAALLHPELGVVAGRDGRLSLIGGDQLLASRLPVLTGRSIRGVLLAADESGWLVGDGGLVLTTQTGGVVWQAPATGLPSETRETIDFRCVDVQGSHVWMTGSPGSTIWHSPDQGRTWEQQRTGQNLPLNQLKFVTETSGIAVGELGVILRTVDGGQTWWVARGLDRRTAWLAISPDPERSPLELGAKLTADEGYRGGIWSASYHQVSENPADEPRDRLPAAALALSLNVADLGWQLPVDRPDLLASDQGLMQRWQARAEQRAPQVLVESLVRQIRTYRPDVLFLPYVPEEDALANYIQQATQVAVRQAADSTRSLSLQELAGLEPWLVKRVFQELPPGSRGDVTVSRDDFLPRLGETLQNATEPALSLIPTHIRLSDRSYRRLDSSADATPHAGGFFAGLDAAPGTPTRRLLSTIDEQTQQLTLKRAQAQRNFLAYRRRAQTDPTIAANLVAQLPDVLRDLATEQSVALMTELAQSYRDQSQYELAESTYLELVRRHPEHPAALNAMRWLMQYWTSTEVAYQRLRGRGQSMTIQGADPAAVQQRLQQGQPGDSAFLAAPMTIADVLPRRASQSSSLTVSRGVNAEAPPNAMEQWQRRAAEMAAQMSEQAPRLFQQPEIQLPFAALMRTRKSAGQSDEVYRRFQRTTFDGPLAALIEQELWLAKAVTTPPRKLAQSQTVQQRPYLDGVLSDPCWQAAQELPLSPPSLDPELPSPSSGFVMFAHDREFLYIAAHVRREGRQSNDILLANDRDHDADLTGHDRLGIALDIDRDYTTWYEFAVDHRGQTSDRCWEDATFNPKWFVACDSDAERWQLEIAIPWSELTSTAPEYHDVWGISVVRVIPQEGQHGLSQPAHWPPTWDTFGLLRFE